LLPSEQREYQFSQLIGEWPESVRVNLFSVCLGACRCNFADSQKPLSRSDASNLEKANPMKQLKNKEYDDEARK
jgi:hypothetical protein